MGHYRTRQRIMRDATEAYAFFISAIFSKQIGLEMIMNYMYIYK